MSRLGLGRTGRFAESKHSGGIVQKKRHMETPTFQYEKVNRTGEGSRAEKEGDQDRWASHASTLEVTFGREKMPM